MKASIANGILHAGTVSISLDALDMAIFFDDPAPLAELMAQPEDVRRAACMALVAYGRSEQTPARPLIRPPTQAPPAAIPRAPLPRARVVRR